MKIATVIKRYHPLENQWWVKVSPPIDGNTNIVVSVGNPGFNETYLFGATEKGEIRDFMDLPGSQRGFRDHGRALREAGYTVVEGKE